MTRERGLDVAQGHMGSSEPVSRRETGLRRMRLPSRSYPQPAGLLPLDPLLPEDFVPRNAALRFSQPAGWLRAAPPTRGGCTPPLDPPGWNHEPARGGSVLADRVGQFSLAVSTGGRLLWRSSRCAVRRPPYCSGKAQEVSWGARPEYAGPVVGQEMVPELTNPEALPAVFFIFNVPALLGCRVCNHVNAPRFLLICAGGKFLIIIEGCPLVNHRIVSLKECCRDPALLDACC